MTIQKLLKDTHKRARHRGGIIIIDIIFPNGKPVIKRQQCTCIVLSQALIENIANILFGDFNEPTMRLVFEELAEVPSEVAEAYRASAAVTECGRVVTWGIAEEGGYSSMVEKELKSGVVHVAATSSAFAAITDRGRVVTWGDMIGGGNSSEMAGELASGVVKVVASKYAFAALKDNGRVVTWGNGGLRRG